MRTYTPYSRLAAMMLAATTLSGCLIFDDPMPPNDMPLHDTTPEEREFMCLDICEQAEPYSLTCHDRETMEFRGSIEVSPSDLRRCDESCVESVDAFAQLGCEMTVGEYRRITTRVRTCDEIDEIATRLLECLFESTELAQ